MYCLRIINHPNATIHSRRLTALTIIAHAHTRRSGAGRSLRPLTRSLTCCLRGPRHHAAPVRPQLGPVRPQFGVTWPQLGVTWCQIGRAITPLVADAAITAPRPGLGGAVPRSWSTALVHGPKYAVREPWSQDGAPWLQVFGPHQRSLVRRSPLYHSGRCPTVQQSGGPWSSADRLSPVVRQCEPSLPVSAERGELTVPEQG